MPPRSRLGAYLRRDEKLALHIVVFLAVIYLLLTFIISLLPVTILDVKFSAYIQHYQRPWLDELMYIISWSGTSIGAVITVLSAAIAFWIGKRGLEARFVILTGLSFPIITLAKLIMNRQRPTEDLVRVVYQAHFQSFPSGHVAFYTVFFGFLAYLFYKMKTWPRRLRHTLGTFCVLMVFMVPFSRVYLGVHWFTDVLAGFFLGLIILIGLLKWYTWARNKKAKNAP